FVAMSLKTFVPIALIVVCATLVFFVRPRYVEGRIGLGITALLTLVALQLTSSASLTDVDYLMMLDKIYLLAYVFIIVALARVVGTSWRGGDPEAETRTSRADRVWAGLFLLGFVAATLAVAGSTLAVSRLSEPLSPRGRGWRAALSGARALPQGESGNGHAGENIAG
ncbi:MAG TPA: hypothetical protein VHK26_02430, partial [Methyloceanibacter sp.]|nr:hypothetical protein [Methyloceanibacter sp.]